MTLAIDPVGPLAHIYDAAFDFAVARHAAVSISYTRWDDFDESNTVDQELGASFRYYLGRRFDSAFGEAGADLRQRDERYLSGETKLYPEPDLLAGYQYTFENGLTVSAAAGAAIARVFDPHTMQVRWAGYLRVGYAR